MSNGNTKAGVARDKALAKAEANLYAARKAATATRDERVEKAEATYHEAVNKADADYQKALAKGG